MQIRTLARTGVAILAGLFAALILVQVFLAGLGVFDDPSAFITHRDFGYTIGLLILPILILALVGRGPRVVVGLAILLAIQMTLQSVFVAMRADNPQVAALHPVNGVLMLIVTIVLAREAWAARLDVPVEAPSPAASKPPATTSDPGG
jgi:mercuric ion transport protein